MAMSCPHVKIYLTILSIACTLLPRHATSAQFNWDGVEKYLPSWPITQVGSEIPPSLIATWEKSDNSFQCPGTPEYHAFPSKPCVDGSPLCQSPPSPSPLKPDDCDDRDSNLFAGLLCAAGVSEGCQAVREAQDPSSGLWARSPRIRWKLANWCPSQQDQHTGEYCQICANAFSRDHGLGSMLYIAKTKDYRALSRWYNAMEALGKHGQLCKVGGGCAAFWWARYCDHDLGCIALTKDGKADPNGSIEPPTPISTPFGSYYGNACMLLPVQDSGDYDLMARITGTHMGPLMTNATQSDDLIQAEFTALLGTAITGTPTPIVLPPNARDEISALASSSGFPLHLQATRILLRMVINNPDLKMSNLPPLPPDPAHAPLMPDSQLETLDPVQLHAEAKTLWAKEQWNPFFNLLANGPTESVKNAILKLCPASSDPPLLTRLKAPVDWRWETDQQDELDVSHSMGWDCVFVASLYNEMRVRQNLVAELQDYFEKYADPISVGLGSASNALDEANADSQKVYVLLQQAQAALDTAHSLVSGALSQHLSDLRSQQKQLQGQVNSLNDQIKKAQDQLNKLLPVCPGHLPPLVTPYPCVSAADKANLVHALDSLTDQVRHLTSQLTDVSGQIANLSVRAGQAGVDLEKRTYENQIAQYQAAYDAQQKLVEQTSQRVKELKTSYDRVNGLLKVWNGI